MDASEFVSILPAVLMSLVWLVLEARIHSKMSKSTTLLNTLGGEKPPVVESPKHIEGYDSRARLSAVSCRAPSIRVDVQN